MGSAASLLARPISSTMVVRSLRSSTRRRSIWSIRSRHRASACWASRGIGLLKISRQVAHERFEPGGIAFYLAYDGAAHYDGFDMIGECRYVFGLRDAEAHGERKAGVGAHTLNERQCGIGDVLLFA